MRIVHFGAGNIGRGAIPEIFDGLYEHLTFVDPIPVVVDKINHIKHYDIKHDKIVHVTNYDAILMSNEKALIEAIAKADIVSTACGFDNLAAVAKILNQVQFAPNKVINVVCFENNVRPSSHLAALVNNQKNYKFVDCTIDRVIPKQAVDANSLDIATEDYLNVVVESKNILNKKAFSHCQIVDDLTNYISLKLYGVNGLHYITAILGYNLKHHYIFESLEDKKVVSLIHTYVKYLTKYLVEVYHFDQVYIANFLANNLKRFENKKILDECSRVARNSKLKLSADNRVMPIFKYFLDKPSQDPELKVLKTILLELFQYNNPEDADSVEIQNHVKTHGVEATIKKYAGFKLA